MFGRSRWLKWMSNALQVSGGETRLPCVRRLKTWCLNVGSAVVAREAVADAAGGRIDVVALQEAMKSVSDYQSFDTPPACLGAPAPNKGKDGREHGRVILSVSKLNKTRPAAQLSSSGGQESLV